MTDQNKFDDLLHECAVWETMCPDAVDGLLTESEQAAFDRHLAGCVHCSEEYAAAQRGAAWLGMLKGQTPEPPEGLMARILAETSGSAEAYRPSMANEPVFVPAPEPAWIAPVFEPTPQSWFVSFQSKVKEMFRIESGSLGFQPHYAMTAAMAFFSIALTLNLMGVRITDLHHLSLKPGTIGRQMADASASATRSFQNLRVVYQLESRVSELSNDSDASTTQDQHPQQDQQEQPKKQARPHGSSELQFRPQDVAPKHEAGAETRLARKES